MGRDARNEVPLADETAGYVDMFSDLNDNLEPEFSPFGTYDIAWPRGWTQRTADRWRDEHGAGRDDEPASEPQKDERGKKHDDNEGQQGGQYGGKKRELPDQGAERR
jgi:hypothetical protein